MKHFIHLNDFSKQEIFQIFELADKLKADNGECDWLKGKTIVLFFPESSIRTRVSFEKGIKMLGGDTILFPPEALDKKEDIKDVIGYLENWADMLIVRHKDLSLIYSNYKCDDSCKSSMRDINRFVFSFKEICGLLGKGMSFYGFKGEYWKYMERGIGISGIQFYTVLS